MTYPKPLEKDEEKIVIEKAYNGCELSQSKLIEHNLRLVIYIANKYKNTEVESDDLISIGSIGLIKAVNTFNPHKNIKFATYASRCISNEILMHLRKEKKKRKEMFLEDTVKSDSEGNSLSIMDVVGTGKEEIEHEILLNDNVKIIKSILYTLPEDERKIIQFRFGIDCERKKQTDIARFFNISQSYVSRIERKVLKKIKNKFEKTAV